MYGCTVREMDKMSIHSVFTKARYKTSNKFTKTFYNISAFRNISS